MESRLHHGEAPHQEEIGPKESAPGPSGPAARRFRRPASSCSSRTRRRCSRSITWKSLSRLIRTISMSASPRPSQSWRSSSTEAIQVEDAELASFLTRNRLRAVAGPPTGPAKTGEEEHCQERRRGHDRRGRSSATRSRSSRSASRPVLEAERWSAVFAAIVLPEIHGHLGLAIRRQDVPARATPRPSARRGPDRR